MLFPFDVRLRLVTAAPKSVSTTFSAFVFLLFTWGQTLLTGITEGNKPAFTDKLDRWIDPWFNSAGYQEQQISIPRVKHTHLPLKPQTEQMDSHLHTVFFIRLTHCSCDSEREYGKCQLNYIAFIPLKAIVEKCKGSQSIHKKGANAICLENNDQSSTSNLLVRPRIQSLCSSIIVNVSCIICEKKSEPQLIESALSHQDYFYY